jgi:hypothetical protein
MPEVCEALGEAIEAYFGFEVPPGRKGNPFTYNGDKKIKKEHFQVDVITVERAASPIWDAVFYRVHVTAGMIEMARYKLNGRDVWTWEQPENGFKDRFLFVKAFLEGFEEKLKVEGN